MRSLILILGDQLDADSSAFDGFDPKLDAIWMAEVAHESTKVWSTKPRIAVFLAAMRHFRDALLKRGWKVHYRELTGESAVWRAADGSVNQARGETFSEALRESLDQLMPERVVMVQPGEWSVREEIRVAMKVAGQPFEMREDRHFLCSREEFEAHAEGRKQPLRFVLDVHHPQAPLHQRAPAFSYGAVRGFRASGAEHDRGQAVGRAGDGRFQGQAQVGVQHDPQRRGAARQTAGQLRVVAQDRADAHEDGLVVPPQALGQPEGGGTGDVPRVAGRGGDAAVQTLGVAHRDAWQRGGHRRP